jgi:hypothetical protein|tara:strand:- start:772 stop:975 length:204 start_codon:yes stop_codon:yes gene_type:complete
MSRKNSRNIRVDGNLADDLEKLKNIRVMNGLANTSEMTTPEITGLLRKTQGWKISIEELKRKPKKRT